MISASWRFIGQSNRRWITAADQGNEEGRPPKNKLIEIAPHSGLPEDVGLLVHIHVELDGSSGIAQDLYAKFVQNYAERLANESARQEASGRAPGVRVVEITQSSVTRARESLEEQAVAKRIGEEIVRREGEIAKRIEEEVTKRQKPTNLLEAAALAGTPILSGAAGVMGSYLHGAWQDAVFALVALGAVACVLYLLYRRLL